MISQIQVSRPADFNTPLLCLSGSRPPKMAGDLGTRRECSRASLRLLGQNVRGSPSHVPKGPWVGSTTNISVPFGFMEALPQPRGSRGTQSPSASRTPPRSPSASSSTNIALVGTVDDVKRQMDSLSRCYDGGNLEWFTLSARPGLPCPLMKPWTSSRPIRHEDHARLPGLVFHSANPPRIR